MFQKGLPAMGTPLAHMMLQSLFQSPAITHAMRPVLQSQAITHGTLHSTATVISASSELLAVLLRHREQEMR